MIAAWTSRGRSLDSFRTWGWASGLGFRVLRFRFWGLGFRVLGFWGLGFRV